DEPGLVVDDLPEPGESPPQFEGRRLIMRLLVAFCLCVALAAICFVVLFIIGMISLIYWMGSRPNTTQPADIQPIDQPVDQPADQPIEHPIDSTQVVR
ncbi:MAG TPA: hypothetical protein PK402_07795, partial [Tepidisphaeraceae bacterium]|nr:hypothetical protein [Tepidisphaeraceae bacterium]